MNHELSKDQTKCSCGWHAFVPDQRKSGSRFDIGGNVFYQIEARGRDAIWLAPRYGAHLIDYAGRRSVLAKARAEARSRPEPG